MNKREKPRRIGCCISPHGFGHAARALAVMQCLSERLNVIFDIVTTVPEWFFRQSLEAPFTLHRLKTDIGMIQRSSLEEDLPATLQALDNFYPLADERVEQAAVFFAGCDIILCDIAPLGIVAAQHLGIPSVLLENFTWDWIYDGYMEHWPQIQTHRDYLGDVFSKADHHIQVMPVCSSCPCQLMVPPVARPLKGSAHEMRCRLNIDSDSTLVLLTMGGTRSEPIPLKPMQVRNDMTFVLPGGTVEVSTANIRCLDQDADIYHPDLVAAADVVVGKVGYSTLAEVYQADVPFAYIRRQGFRESDPLAHFIEHNMRSCELTVEQLYNGTWLDALSFASYPPCPRPEKVDGADQVAAYIADFLSH